MLIKSKFLRYLCTSIVSVIVALIFIDNHYSPISTLILWIPAGLIVCYVINELKQLAFKFGNWLDHHFK